MSLWSSPQSFNVFLNPLTVDRRGREFNVSFIFGHGFTWPPQFFVKHAEPSIGHCDRVLTSSGLQIQLFSLLLMQFPVLLTRGRGQQIAFLFLNRALLSFLSGVFFRAITQFLLSQLL